MSPLGGSLSPWQLNNFVGSRGASQALDAFAVKLSGTLSHFYGVQYWGYYESVGEIGPCEDGNLCLFSGNILTAIRVELHDI